MPMNVAVHVAIEVTNTRKDDQVPEDDIQLLEPTQV